MAHHFGGGIWCLNWAEPQSAGHSNVQRLKSQPGPTKCQCCHLVFNRISSCNKKKQRLKSSSSLHEGSYLSVHRPRILSALGIHGRTTLPGHCFPETLRRMARGDTQRGRSPTVSQSRHEARWHGLANPLLGAVPPRHGYNIVTLSGDHLAARPTVVTSSKNAQKEILSKPQTCS